MAKHSKAGAQADLSNQSKLTEITRHSSDYPASLKHCPAQYTPDSFYALGNLDILKQKNIALFCSIRCPGSIILQVFDFIKSIQQTKITIISGFHSPMERECLEMLLRGKQHVIACPARALHNMRIKKEFKKPIDEGRLLLLSPFQDHHNRISLKNSTNRNYFVAAVADAIFIAHAAPDSKTEQFCKEIVSLQKPSFTLDNDINKNLIGLGARPVLPNDIPSL
jgi:predicted Rossmann fold nucleotide-binding protein DprA/Smf involved in DNA uptake